jgi:beta-galactosidase
MQKLYFYISFCLLFQLNSIAQPRSVIDFNKDWKFYLGNDSTAKEAAYDDSKWRKLSLPHDWSIESDFKKDAPATTQGGALPGGVGWYRKIFSLPASAKDKNVSIEFDGVYKNSEVWINGHYLGKRPNGYSTFSYDLTPFIFSSLQKNVIVVKVDNSQQPDSRWYTGSGIYRNVKLVIKNKIAFDRHGTFIRAFVYSNDNGNPINYDKTKRSFGSVNIETSLHTKITKQGKLTLIHTIYDAAGKKVSSSSKPYEFQIDTMYGINTRMDGGLTINDPILWSVDNPYLYKVVSTVFQNNIPVDEVTTNIGIRLIKFESEKGFFLNNEALKIKGVCMHHDLGALGAAFNITAAKRQLKILKEMGCNAIRFSHNPPASEFLDLCDQMGFLVIDEAFDMWQKRKNKFDYHLDFKEWYKKDLEAMVLRDRNHPSVFMWSIGNEIREQFDSTGTSLTKELVDIVKQLDPTRPVISALTETFSGKKLYCKSKCFGCFGV